MDDRNLRALFTHMDYRDKLPDHLSALAGVPINRDLLELCIDSVHSSWIDKHGRYHTMEWLVQLAFAPSYTRLHDSQLTSMVAVRWVLL